MERGFGKSRKYVAIAIPGRNMKCLTVWSCRNRLPFLSCLSIFVAMRTSVMEEVLFSTWSRESSCYAFPLPVGTIISLTRWHTGDGSLT